MSSSALPAIPSTALPAAVRTGSAQDQRDYKAALGFEQVLLGQLVHSMIPEDSELASGPYAETVKDAFAEGIANSGGIGLAGQLFQTMQRTRA
jgi:hypothetical protein